MWALYGRRWYPGRLVNISDLPENLRGSFKHPKGLYIIEWYGEDQYSFVSKVDILAENRIGAQLRTISDKMFNISNVNFT